MTTTNYSPRAEDGEKPCGEQVGTMAGVRRHERAKRRAEAANVVFPPEYLLAACALCTGANRENARELYNRKKVQAKS